MMRGILFKLSPVFLVAACQSTGGIHTEFVDRPVITIEKCIDDADIPQTPQDLKKTPHPSDLERALSLALAKISEWERYGHKTNEILKKCTK